MQILEHPELVLCFLTAEKCLQFAQNLKPSDHNCVLRIVTRKALNYDTALSKVTRKDVMGLFIGNWALLFRR